MPFRFSTRLKGIHEPIQVPMTSRERVLAVYRNQMPDRLPVGIYGRYHRVGTVERRARADGLAMLVYYPVTSLLAPPWHVAPGYLSEVKGAEFSVRFVYEEGRMVEERRYSTRVGDISQQVVKDPSNGSDWIRKPYLTETEDYKVMQFLVENSVLEPHQKCLKRMKDDLGEDGVVIGRLDRSPFQKLLIELSDPQIFLMEYMTEPGVIETLLEMLEERESQQVDMALDMPVDAIWQPDNVTCDLTPPNIFEKYCAPFYRKQGAKLRDANKIYLIHLDGRLAPLATAIAGSVFDVVESFSFAEMGNNLSEVDALKFWPDKVLCPNFPSTLSGKTREEITAFCESKMQAFGHRPFMLQVSEDIPLDAYAHVLASLTSFFSSREMRA